MPSWWRTSPSELDAILAGGVGGASILHQEPVLLNNTQIKALPTTRIEVVAAPGANKILLPLSAVLVLTAGTGYGNINADDYLTLSHDDGNVDKMSYCRNETALFTQLTSFLSGNRTLFLVPSAAHDASASALCSFSNSTASLVNKNLVLSTSGLEVDWTGGDPANTLRVSVSYMVLDVITGLFE